jgi:hypothetical protein
MFAPRQVFAENGVGQQCRSGFHEEQYSRRVNRPALALQAGALRSRTGTAPAAPPAAANPTPYNVSYA